MQRIGNAHAPAITQRPLPDDFHTLHVSVVEIPENRRVGIDAQWHRRHHSVEQFVEDIDAQRRRGRGSRPQRELVLRRLFEPEVRVAATESTRAQRVVEGRIDEILEVGCLGETAPARDERRALQDGREAEPWTEAAPRAVHGTARDPGAGIELVVAQPKREHEVRPAQLPFRVRRNGHRCEGRGLSGRYAVTDGQIAQGPLEGFHLLPRNLSAKVEIAVRTSHAEIGLTAQLVELVPRHSAGRPATEEECGHAPRRPIAEVGSGESGNGRARRDGVLAARQLVAGEPKRAAGERSEAVPRLLGERPPLELAREVTGAQVGGEIVARALQVGADQVATHALPRRAIGVVLVDGIVQQPLLDRSQREQAQGV